MARCHLTPTVRARDGSCHWPGRPSMTTPPIQGSARCYFWRPEGSPEGCALSSDRASSWFFLWGRDRREDPDQSRCPIWIASIEERELVGRVTVRLGLPGRTPLPANVEPNLHPTPCRLEDGMPVEGYRPSTPGGTT